MQIKVQIDLLSQRNLQIKMQIDLLSQRNLQMELQNNFTFCQSLCRAYQILFLTLIPLHTTVVYLTTESVSVRASTVSHSRSTTC